MKKYRSLVPIVLILLMLASWYMMISSTAKTDNTYNEYLTEARRWANDGITKYAVENYEAALKVKETPEVYVEVSEFYKSVDKPKDNLSWCKKFFEKYPTDYRSYDCLIDAYYQEQDYKSCYDVLETSEKRNVNSDHLNEIADSIKYEFQVDFNSYSDVGTYSNNFCSVSNKDLWGFVDRFGNKRIAGNYIKVGSYTKSGFASVVNKDGSPYFIDKTGSKVITLKDEYESFGLLVGSMFPAKNANGKYVYLSENKDIKDNPALYVVASEEYDYASTFNNGVAVVKVGDEWQIIDEKFEIISEGYSDIKLDEKEIAYRNDRLFVSKGDKQYIMIDKDGNQIGDLVYEDAMVFASELPTAVRVEGKWSFVDKGGKLISDHTYENARPMINDFAAVCINGKWGFVDSEESLAIEPQFFDAKDFNEKGSCFVKTGDKWQLLKLFRLNRED